jgi:hypothetical protein
VRVFSFDLREQRERFLADGWVWIRGGVDPEFFGYLRDFVSCSFGEHQVSGKAIDGQKDQALLEFPAEVDMRGDVYDVIASLTGLDAAGMTLSERHIKAYNADAQPEPLAHKDRFSSQISVGISIEVPDVSRLVLYPYEHRSDNPFNVSKALLASLEESQHPAVALADAREVEIPDRPGDVLVFPGRSMWHKRRNPANTVNLYLKFNDFGSDPLGEDPFTDEIRERTMAVLANGVQLETLVPLPGRRLDTVTRQYTREWGELLQANVWERVPLTLSEAEFELLRRADGRRRLEELAPQLPGANGHETLEHWVRRLAGNSAIELVAGARDGGCAKAELSVTEPADRA